MPQKQKLSAEEKAKVIEDYINNRISLSEAAQRGGVARDTISQWARNYEADGMTAFMTCKNRVYSPELKRQAVEDYLSGKGSQAELSKKYGLRDRRQLRNWLKVYNAHGDFNSRKNSGGGSYMKQGRDTTQEERIQIVKDCLASGKDYLHLTRETAERCENHDLTDSMVIGTSAIVDTELDGVVGMNSGIFNNPFMIWGKYRRGLFKTTLKLSFQFYHTQMDGAHAGRILQRLQESILALRG